MRSLVVLSVLVGLLSLLSWLKPELANSATSFVSEYVGDIGIEKEIQITGLTLLSQSDILKLLPMDRSIAWWRLNSAQIESELQSHALIKDAKVAPCRQFGLRCFSVSVAEREPAFLALLGAETWLIGGDGGFITPVPSSRLEHGAPNLANGRKPVWIRGLMSDAGAPDVVKAKINYLRRIMELVEVKLGLQVEEMLMREGGETAIKLAGLDLLAVFDLAANDDLSRISDEADRLKALIGEYGARISEVESVDLAFNKVAVVKVKEISKSEKK